ncbi:MAG: serine/threonine-protein kinase [Planctomycetota bacterium]
MELARLTATTEGHSQPFVVLAARPLTLGRSRRCGLRLRDPKVSREHCCLTYFGGDLLVNDLGSAHGLVFHGERNESFRLKVGDGFHLGRTFVRFDALGTIDDAELAAADAAAKSDEGEDEADGEGEAAAGEPAAVAPAPAVAAAAPVAWHELPPGAELAGFVVETVLGRSDRSIVYRAAQTQLQRKVALKVLNRPAGTPPGAAARAAFLADVRTAAAIVDPALVPVFDVLDTTTECAATLELIDGETLAARLQRSPPAWRELLPLLADVAQGLAVLHQQGRVHGGVKPGNVFLPRKGGARLADPRAVPRPRALEPDALPSPEQRALTALDARSDLFGLGALAWLALTGSPPPAAPAPVLLLRADPLLPKAIAELIALRLLANDPAGRPASASSVRDELSAALGPTKRSSATAASSPPPPSRTRDAAPRPVARPTPSGDLSARASPGVRFAARLTSEAIIVGMILLIVIPTLVVLKVKGVWDPIGQLADLFSGKK